MRKKFLSTLLALAMVLTLLPVGAFAVEGDEETAVGPAFESTAVSVEEVSGDDGAKTYTAALTISGTAATSYKVYDAATAGTALDDGNVKLENSSLTITFSDAPTEAKMYYVAAVESDNTESARTPVAIHPDAIFVSELTVKTTGESAAAVDLTPAFDTITESYAGEVAADVASISVTATAADAENATVAVKKSDAEGASVVSDDTAITLDEGTTAIEVTVTGTTENTEPAPSKTYTITITKAAGDDGDNEGNTIKPILEGAVGEDADAVTATVTIKDNDVTFKADTNTIKTDSATDGKWTITGLTATSVAYDDTSKIATITFDAAPSEATEVTIAVSADAFTVAEGSTAEAPESVKVTIPAASDGGGDNEGDGGNEENEIATVAITLAVDGLKINDNLPNAESTEDGVTLTTEWTDSSSEKATTITAAGTYTAEITVAAKDAETKPLADTVTYTLNGKNVTAANNILTYELTITGGDDGSETAASLASLSVNGSAVTISDAMTAEVSTAAVTIAATASGEGTVTVTRNTETVDISKEVALTEGANAFTITVSEADKTAATYTLTITYTAPEPEKAELETLTVKAAEDGDSLIDFDSKTTDYSATVASTVSSVTVTATAAEGVDVSIAKGEDAVSNGSVSLDAGVNTITVTVGSADDGTENVYTVTIFKAGTTTSVTETVETNEVKDGVVEKELNADTVTAAIAAVATGSESEKVVKIDVVSGSEAVTAAAVTLPVDVIKALETANADDGTDVSAVVTTDAGSVELTPDVISKIAEASASEEGEPEAIVLKVGADASAEITEPDEALADQFEAFDIGFFTASTDQEVPVKELTGKITVTVKIPASLRELASIVLAHFDETTEKWVSVGEPFAPSDCTNHLYSFTTAHLSTWGLMSQEALNAANSEDDGNGDGDDNEGDGDTTGGLVYKVEKVVDTTLMTYKITVAGFDAGSACTIQVMPADDSGLPVIGPVFYTTANDKGVVSFGAPTDARVRVWEGTITNSTESTNAEKKTGTIIVNKTTADDTANNNVSGN